MAGRHLKEFKNLNSSVVEQGFYSSDFLILSLLPLLCRAFDDSPILCGEKILGLIRIRMLKVSCNSGYNKLKYNFRISKKNLSLTNEVPKIIFGNHTSGVEPSIKTFSEVIGAVIILVHADPFGPLGSKPVSTVICIQPSDSSPNLS